ncbi:hypothetical protein JGS39_26300 [Streptomyces sp. P01-B04]|uniref:hypothetical protein n=1 Tax=Streptomyces poriferorum TaxID=2798799 RepID=UPI001C5FE2D5|nr:hypothetical protein [Streptomyces poriferorum]MBW5252462.1 hypothetical protein [Streptomyces poriferorum]MBW5260468.1 hypothetical protein [Streptomyces poriferorum]
MTVHQHAVSIGEFAHHLRGVAALLDPARGWYGVFCRRDPEGMRACLAGAEIPPWDVMESLFADLATVRGAAFAERASVRAAELYAASAAAHDRRPGGQRQLVERLELMLREQANAAGRLSAARAGGETGGAGAEAVAWARDDHARASARCTELRRRLAAVAALSDRFRAEGEPVPGAPVPPAAAPPQRPMAVGDAPEEAVRDTPGPSPVRAGGPSRRRPRGARFAGLDVEEEPVAAAPVLPVPPVAAALPRGARFGGALRTEGAPPGHAPAAQDQAALRSARATVATLVRLRTEGLSGEAHGVLCEAAGRPAEMLPVLAVELHRAGLGADWSTLLWEVSSLPPAELAAAVDALAGAGRPEDCGHLLRQGVARPPAEIADAVIALDRAGRGPQAQALLGAFVRVRTPQDAARIAESDPRRLVPHLLAAARTVSGARERDVEHALRIAGIA